MAVDDAADLGNAVEDEPVSLSAGYYNSFVVRIWSRAGGVVQGQITHVATHKTLRFKDPQRMLRFIQAHVAPTPNGEGDDSSEQEAAEP